MENDKEILDRLYAISNEEWLETVKKLTSFVYFKLQGKTLFGAHSESNLGVNPVEYYVDTAVEKLFNLEWKWQFEKYSLFEQLQRIVGSMISANVEKYRTNKDDKAILVDDELLSSLSEKIIDESTTNELYDIFKDALEVCSKDDEELQLYVMALDECSTFDEMSIILGMEKKRLYVLQKKLTRRVKGYLETKKKH